MFKIKFKLRGTLMLMVFAIFAITCLTLVNSAAAVATDSNQDVNARIISDNEDSLEIKASPLSIIDKTSKNGKKEAKKSVNTKDKSSSSDKKKIKKASAKSIENTSQKMTVANVNSSETEKNDTNTSNSENNTTVVGNQKVDPINNFGIESQAIGLVLFSIFCVISFSSFIMYLRS